MQILKGPLFEQTPVDLLTEILLQRPNEGLKLKCLGFINVYLMVMA